MESHSTHYATQSYMNDLIYYCQSSVTMMKGNKPICVMDTDTLLFSFKLDCPPNRVIDRLDRQFDLFFPHKVKEEYENKVRQGVLGDYDDFIPDINLFLKRKSSQKRLVEERKYSHCLKYLQRFFNLMGMQERYNKLGDGEKHCVALGLFMSRIRKDCVIVATDDFGAREAGIDLFVCKQFIGMVRPLLGAMVFVYCVSTDIPEWRMRTLVKEYFDLNPPTHVGMRNFKEKILKEIELCCRRQNYDECKLSCLA